MSTISVYLKNFIAILCISQEIYLLLPFKDIHSLVWTKMRCDSQVLCGGNNHLDG